MKLLRIKITDPKGFRSLQAGFEYVFRTEWELQDEQRDGAFEPFVCAGLNGSGKSNLMEALAAIFFELEAMRIRRNFLPEALQEHIDSDDPSEGLVDGFELEYLIKAPHEVKGNLAGASLPMVLSPDFSHVKVTKAPGKSIKFEWLNRHEFKTEEIPEDKIRDFLLPEYILGYSSGENQILSLPFFKMRFVQFDEYWNALENRDPYPGRPESRMAYLDDEFSQAILLCNLLFHDEEALKPYREEVGIQSLKSFRIILKRRIDIKDVEGFDYNNPAVIKDLDTGDSIAIEALHLLQADEYSKETFDPILNKLRRCATCWNIDISTDTLYLDYYVNDATRQAFSENFDFELNKSPIALFQAFQVLLTLNLYSTSKKLKRELYQSHSHYVSETVPTLASDQRVMRFKFVEFTKAGIDKPVMLKSLSDGEHQLVHSLGLCLLFRNNKCLFLLDEPETHFNPHWRASFISGLQDCFEGAKGSHEMLISTHSPFLISDSRPEKVLFFNKIDNNIHITHPDYNTLGASTNKITMTTFGKRETIGGHAQEMLDSLRKRFDEGEDSKQLIPEINSKLGDSVEKVLLIKAILGKEEG